MKKFTFSGVTLTTLSLLVFAPVLSHAQVEINSESDTFLQATTNLSTTDTEALVDIDANTETGATSSVNNEAHTSAEGSTSASLRLNVDGIAVVSASQVNTENDLEVFAYNTMSREENVADIKAETINETESRVEVKYKHHGRLFGIMPVTVKSTTVVVSNDGELDVDSNLSWWGFLVTDKSRIESDIETRVRDNATIMSSAEAESSASLQAEVIEAMLIELEAYSSLQVESE